MLNGGGEGATEETKCRNVVQREIIIKFELCSSQNSEDGNCLTLSSFNEKLSTKTFFFCSLFVFPMHLIELRTGLEGREIRNRSPLSGYQP